MDEAETKKRREVSEVKTEAYAALDLLEACARQLPPSEAIAELVDRILELRSEFTKVVDEARRDSPKAVEYPTRREPFVPDTG